MDVVVVSYSHRMGEVRDPKGERQGCQDVTVRRLVGSSRCISPTFGPGRELELGSGEKGRRGGRGEGC